MAVVSYIMGFSTVSYAIDEKPNMSFGIISDIHLQSRIDNSGNPIDDEQAEIKLQQALQDLHSINPEMDMLIMNGDLTHTGMQTDYDVLKEILYGTPHPQNTLFAMGNHEFYSAYRLPTGEFSKSTFPNGVTEQACINRFIRNTGMPSLYYDKVIKGYHFIVLGSEESRITNWNNLDSAVLSDTQLQWLDHELKETSKDQPTFVFLHQPIPHTVAGSEQGTIVDSEKLVTILSHFPQVIFFSGHSHITLKNEPYTMYQNHFTMFNDASVRNPVTPFGELIGDSEGLFVKVYKDRVVVTGRDFTNKKWIDSYTVRVPLPKSIIKEGVQ
ncbi:metallophosphoesterase [Pullulanibacillus sp. KACC 23026]|uniref:metallophosphoesterase family protein n=1 Tax=Pullulanibacillus sp. KACC 23026 TaxID=3028315 RepID=UPI0023AF1A40|nr:metallophosphoesterase [Pullulanibacillus sp. KACC 23026]WEG10994.1 metallophosphoesterase [Pullulanibacillus sp. KACC 23026]